MPIVIRAQGSESTFDVIKKFKKAVMASNIVQIAKDRAVYQKPSQVRAVKKIAKNRLQKRSRKLKRMKNISPIVLQKIADRLSQ
jgi:ribosomal protein S21